MIRRPILAVVAALACGLALAGCGSDGGGGGDAGSATPVSLILDWYPNVDHAGIYGAIDQGYFADEGLRVSPSVPSDPSAALKQIGLGRADFAISYEQEVLIARSEGIPVVAVGALVDHPLNTVLFRRDRGISSAKDLEGKTVGVAGVPSDEPLLDQVVRTAGGDPSKVTVRNIGYTLSPALAAGKVDAVLGAFWNVEQIELVRSFLKALRQGQDWAATDQAGAVDALVAANKDLDPETVAAQLDVTAPLLSPSDEATLNVDPAKWRSFADWMRQNGLLSKPVDVDAAVTSEFLPPAR